MKLIFARHGESQANLLHVFSNREQPHPLTPLGRDQAQRLADRLKGEPIERIYVSPVLRARQTAEIVSGTLGIPWEVTGALREYDVGVLEGTSAPEGWRLYDEILMDWVDRQRWDRGFDEGESFNDMRRRFLPFVTNLVSQYRLTPSALLLVTHGGLLRCMLPVLVDNIGFQFALSHPIANTAVIQVEPHGEALVCTEWCGLTGADLPLQSSG